MDRGDGETPLTAQLSAVEPFLSGHACRGGRNTVKQQMVPTEQLKKRNQPNKKGKSRPRGSVFCSPSGGLKHNQTLRASPADKHLAPVTNLSRYFSSKPPEFSKLYCWREKTSNCNPSAAAYCSNTPHLYTTLHQKPPHIGSNAIRKWCVCSKYMSVT